MAKSSKNKKLFKEMNRLYHLNLRSGQSKMAGNAPADQHEVVEVKDGDLGFKTELWNLKKDTLYKEIQSIEESTVWERRYNEVAEKTLKDQKLIADLKDELLSLQSSMAVRPDEEFLHSMRKNHDKAPFFREKEQDTDMQNPKDPPDFQSIFEQLDEEIFFLNDLIAESDSKTTNISPRHSLEDVPKPSEDEEDCVANAHVIACLCNRVNELEENLRCKNKEIGILCERTQEYANRLTALEENEMVLAQKDRDISHLCEKLEEYANMVGDLDSPSEKAETHIVSRSPSPFVFDNEPEVTKPSLKKHFREGHTRMTEKTDEMEERRNFAHLGTDHDDSKSEQDSLRSDYEALLRKHTIALKEMAQLMEIVESQLPNIRSEFKPSICFS